MFTPGKTKEFSAFFTAINLYNLSTPFNDIFNSTGNSILATNQSEYNVTLSPGDVIYVADYTDALNMTVTRPYTREENPVVPFIFSAVSNNAVDIADYYILYSGSNYSYPTYSQMSFPATGTYEIIMYAIDEIGAWESYTMNVSWTGINPFLETAQNPFMGAQLMIMAVVLVCIVFIAWSIFRIVRAPMTQRITYIQDFVTMMVVLMVMLVFASALYYMMFG